VTPRNTHRRPLTELQQVILDQLWSRGPATADQIREALLPAHRFLTGMVDEKILTPAEIARLARKISLSTKGKKTGT
jgi:predicted transcriptional regulator